MAVVTRSGAKVNTNGNAANVPKGPRRSARVKAAKNLKEQRLLTELAEKKKTLAVEQARATKRAQIAQKSQARRKARATEKAQASEKTEAVEKLAKEYVVAVWKADFNEARALRRAQQKEILTAKQAALESGTEALTIDKIERRKIDAQHRSNVPFYMSYKQFLDSSESRNSGYLERKAVENEWKSFCMMEFAKWRPDPAVFSVKLKNKRLKKALKEVTTGRTHGGEVFDVGRFWEEKDEARGNKLTKHGNNKVVLANLEETETAFLAVGLGSDVEAEEKTAKIKEPRIKKSRHRARETRAGKKEVMTEWTRFKRVQKEKAARSLNAISSQLRLNASTMSKNFVSSSGITQPNLTDWGIFPSLDNDGNVEKGT